MRAPPGRVRERRPYSRRPPAAVGPLPAPPDMATPPPLALGVNLPWRRYGCDFGTNAWRIGGLAAHDTARVRRALDDARRSGAAAVRWFFFCDGRAGIDYDAGGRPLGLQPSALRRRGPRPRPGGRSRSAAGAGAVRLPLGQASPRRQRRATRRTLVDPARPRHPPSSDHTRHRPAARPRRARPADPDVGSLQRAGVDGAPVGAPVGTAGQALCPPLAVRAGDARPTGAARIPSRWVWPRRAACRCCTASRSTSCRCTGTTSTSAGHRSSAAPPCPDDRAPSSSASSHRPAAAARCARFSTRPARRATPRRGVVAACRRQRDLVSRPSRGDAGDAARLSDPLTRTRAARRASRSRRWPVPLRSSAPGDGRSTLSSCGAFACSA